MAEVVPEARSSRTWPQRLLITFNVFLILAFLVGAGGMGWLFYRFGKLPRISFSEGVLAPRVDDPGEPQNFLLVGSDVRPEEDEGQGSQAEVGLPRSDTMILIRIDPETETAAMVSFPRDLVVEIAGTGGQQGRINTAFNLEGGAGAERLIETIKLNFDVPVHHFIQVDFAGFKSLVDTVGGVKIWLDHPVRDYGFDEATGTTHNLSGLDIDQTGCVQLNGDQALAYVRSRHYEEFVDGSWEADPTGDLGRIERQQDFIGRAIQKALNDDLLNPVRLNDLVSVAQDSVTMSESLGMDDIVDLGKRFQDLRPDAVSRYTLPVQSVETSSGGYGGEELVRPEEVAQIFAVFRGEEAGQVEVNPSSVIVRVLNGSGRAGEAASADAALSAAGFGTTGAGNAEATGPETLLFYGLGQRTKAELVASYLGSTPPMAEDATITGADVVMVTGLDYQGVLETPRSTTTTTAPDSEDDDSTSTTIDEETANRLWYAGVTQQLCR